MWKKISIISLALIALNGCSKSPMQQLESDHVYSDMTPAYWAKQQDQNKSLWSQAVSYCQQHAEKPNCSAIMQVFVITNGSTTAPAIGHSGHFLTLPKFQ